MLLAGLVVIALLAGCRSATNGPATATLPATPSQAPATVTPTPEPAVAIVNGDRIRLDDFEAELKRLEAAEARAETTPDPEKQRQRVLDALIDETLLAQTASSAGFKLEDADLAKRVEQLAKDMGGTEALKEWLSKNGYDEAGFERSLKREITMIWQRDRILAEIPEKIEQVHALQIRVGSADKAQSILQQLKNGAVFATLAKEMDPLAGGDLGWIAPGTLYQPEVEKAVFALAPGTFSEVIQTEIGYHIIFVTAREARPLDNESRLTYERKVLSEWLEQRRNESQIEILVP